MLHRDDVGPVLEHLWEVLASRAIGQSEVGPFGWLWLDTTPPDLDNPLLRSDPGRTDLIELINTTDQRWIEITDQSSIESGFCGPSP